MAVQRTPPKLLEKHNFLFKGILQYEPNSAWRFCSQLQEKWKEDYSRDTDLLKCMEHWKESKSLHLVWVSDKFGGTLSDDVSAKRTYVLLTQHYKDFCRKLDDDFLKRVVGSQSLESTQDSTDVQEYLSLVSDESKNGDRNAENDRTSELQLKQHLQSLMFLSRSAEVGISLSENLIKLAHKFLMRGLHTSDNIEIHAGGYRSCSVSADDHVFPHYNTISTSMGRLVTEYNEHQRNREHDPFELASWLVVEFLTIHPFVDGNGRMSRLLWCYSLMLDGLPFPLTPFPEIKRAHKLYVTCVERDRDSLSMPVTNTHTSKISCAFTTSLTIISVTKIWKNFIANLRQESPEKHQEIIEWITRSDIALVRLNPEKDHSELDLELRDEQNAYM